MPGRNASEYTSQFRNKERTEEFKKFLIALAEWKITQIVIVMLKENIKEFGPLTPSYLDFFSLFSAEEQERVRKERSDPRAWEYKYKEAYNNLYHMYKKIALTFPKKVQPIFDRHNIPPTSLYEYLFDHFFPNENEMIREQYRGEEIIVW